MKNLILSLFIGLIVIACQPSTSNLQFDITLGKDVASEALDGRLLLLISNDDSNEPRFQINDGPNTQIVSGINVVIILFFNTCTENRRLFGFRS